MKTETKTNNPAMTPVLEQGYQRIYMVNPGEVWQKGKFRFAPNKTASLIFECEAPWGYTVEECDIRDANTWKWLQESVTNAVAD